MGRGSLDLRVSSSGELTTVTVRDVLHSPDIAYHLFSVRSAALHGNSYNGLENVIRVKRKRREILTFHRRGNINCFEPIRVRPEYAHAVLDPAKGPVSTNRTIDVHVFLAAYAHGKEVLLKDSQGSQFGPD